MYLFFEKVCKIKKGLYLCRVIKNANKMATVKTNIWDLKAGDRITFTNSANYKVDILVKRVEEKSWYATSRNSWGTLQSYAKYPDFRIIRNEN